MLGAPASGKAPAGGVRVEGDERSGHMGGKVSVFHGNPQRESLAAGAVVPGLEDPVPLAPTVVASPSPPA